MQPLRLLVADDHRLMLAALRRIFERVEDVEIVGEVTRGSQVLPAVVALQPDVVLCDLRMPELDGIACVERLRRQGRTVPVVMLSSYDDQVHVDAAREAGASGYVVKTVDPTELPGVVRAAAAGAAFQTVVPEAPRRQLSGAELSERELAVLSALAGGLSNRQIGESLWVSEQTVKFHLRNVYRKLNVTSRTEAVRWAYRHGVASPSKAATG
jgi:DNA-binding NarL/FixJ family response regulator